MSSVASEQLPDAAGRFGPYGGRYVPETLVHPLRELEEEYFRAQQDPEFQRELDYYLREFVGRPTPLYHAQRLTDELGGAKIYLKREDLLHTGAHKINNAMGQILLAKRMGKTGSSPRPARGNMAWLRPRWRRCLALNAWSTWAHTIATGNGLMCSACVCSVRKWCRWKLGQKTLKEAVNEAMRDWVTNVRSTHYILGTAYGAHPYPVMVRNFHRVIGDEARRQILEQEERLPDLLAACVGGGSNAIGLFYPFIEDESVSMVGVEAGGEGIIPEKHAARFQGVLLGVLQGTRSYLLQDEVGQIQMTHSISAGLDYAAVGPEHAWLRDQGRVEYTYATDDQALEAFFRLSKLEGIIPALESSHAVAEVIVRAPQMDKDQIIICNLSGRGDKDVQQVAEKVEM